MTAAYRADKDRMIREFIELTSIDAESLAEREIADVLTRKLQQLGCRVTEDDAAERIGGSAGNLLALLDGTRARSTADGSTGKDGAPILLVAHMDTVVPGVGKEARLQEDGRITGNGRAVLGADDVAGIVEILEGIRILQENGIPYGPLEILFTASEENFCRGITAFDSSVLRAKEAYVLDLAGPVGIAAVQAPSLIWFQITVTGRAAHAGFDPEHGINAVQAAARAIARLPQGRIDPDTTFNLGSIRGGKVSNIVSDSCRITGEVRSNDHARAEEMIRQMEEVFREEIEAMGASFEIKKRAPIHAYRTDTDSPVCRRFRRAAELTGVLPEDGECFTETFGGSDNNILADRGIEGIVMSCGMYNPHSLEEYTTVQDLVKGAELVAAICSIN